MAPATRDAVVRMLSFAPADVTQAAEVSRVIGSDHPDTLVYLACRQACCCRSCRH